MTEKRILHSVNDTREWCSYLYSLPFPIRAAALTGEDRSLDQNALAHKWFTDIANQTGETPAEVKRRAKLDIGCSILRQSDPVFNGFMTVAIDTLSRERQMKAMDYLSVTSLLTVTQMRAFLDQFEKEHRAQGLYMTIPEDRT